MPDDLIQSRTCHRYDTSDAAAAALGAVEHSILRSAGRVPAACASDGGSRRTRLSSKPARWVSELPCAPGSTVWKVNADLGMNDELRRKLLAVVEALARRMARDDHEEALNIRAAQSAARSGLKGKTKAPCADVDATAPRRRRRGSTMKG